MTKTTRLLTLKLDSEAAVAQVIRRLIEADLQVLRSFDLQAARSHHINCACPRHGTARCDCQMIILLVYNQDEQPLTLVAHGRDGKTHFALVDPLDGGCEYLLKNAILQLLSVEGFQPIQQDVIHAI